MAVSTLTVSPETSKQVLLAILPDVEPKYLIDFLYAEGVVSEDEMQVMASKVTRKERCRLLISQLNERPNPRLNFGVLVQALDTQGYHFLKDDVKEILDKDACAIPVHDTGQLVLPTDTHTSELDLVCLSVLPPAGEGLLSSKQTRFLFDRLNEMLNNGQDSQRFNATCDAILKVHFENYDICCVVKYLQACQCILNDNFHSASAALKTVKELSKKSSCPVKSQLYMLSGQCWIYSKVSKLDKLDSHLSDAEQLITTYPVLCQGMASGWIFLNRARYILPLITSKYPEKARVLVHAACNLLDKALDEFNLEESIDGPIGVLFSLILKATVLLRCGCVMNTVQLPVKAKEISEAQSLLNDADGSKIGLPPVVRPNFYIAMSDLMFRRGTYRRAEEYAQQAYNVSQALGLPEHIKQAQARRNYLRGLVDRESERLSIVDTCQMKWICT